MLSAADAAKQLGCDPATVRRSCAAHKIGVQISGTWVLTEADLERLRGVVRAKRGNPKFVPGNYFGGAKKRPKKTSKKLR